MRTDEEYDRLQEEHIALKAALRIWLSSTRGMRTQLAGIRRAVDNPDYARRVAERGDA